jgi:hypothetical protein
MRKLFVLSRKKSGKVLVIRKIVVPLHPLSGKALLSGIEKKSSLRDLHRQRKK